MSQLGVPTFCMVHSTISSFSKVFNCSFPLGHNAKVESLNIFQIPKSSFYVDYNLENAGQEKKEKD